MSTYFEHITSVKVGDYENNSSGAQNGYAKYDTKPIRLEKNKSYEVEIKSNTLTYEYVRVWVDQNNNGEFEPSESIFDEYGVTPFKFTYSTANPQSNSVGMRVALGFERIDATDACIKNVSHGEVEDYLILFDQGTGIQDLYSGQFELFPNPTQREVIIRYGRPSGVKYEISDEQGKLIISGKLKGIDTEIDVETLNSGVYFVKLFSTEFVENKKLIIID